MTAQSPAELILPVDIKLGRAHHHAYTLGTEIATWTASNPLKVRVELLEGRLGYRLILDALPGESPLERWGLLVSECVHHLRSALDNLAFALACLHRNPPTRPDDIAFPIYQDRDRFEKKGRRRINQLSAEAATLVGQLQPFQREAPDVEGTPASDGLVLLQLLSNADKHRLPPVVLVAPSRLTHNIAVKFYSDEDAAANAPLSVTHALGPLVPGVVFAECKTTRPIESVRGQWHVEAVVALQCAGESLPTGEIMQKLWRYTVSIVKEFRPLFRTKAAGAKD